jgi:hypothetical protein
MGKNGIPREGKVHEQSRAQMDKNREKLGTVICAARGAKSLFLVVGEDVLKGELR